MKIILNREAIEDVLSTVIQAVPSRTPKPVLRCVKLSAEKEALTIEGTDLEVYVRCVEAQVDVKKTGKLIVPADKLYAIIKESRDDVLEISSDDEGSCRISGSDSSYTLITSSSDSFGERQPSNAKSFTVKLGELKEAIGQAIIAVSKEATRYALNGVCFSLNRTMLALAATDCRRLAVVKVKVKKGNSKWSDEKNIVVPTKALSIVSKLKQEDKTPVTVDVDGPEMTLQCGSTVVITGLIEGIFPKYEEIIPTDYETKIKVDTAALISAVRRAALLTNDNSQAIKFTISADKIVLAGHVPECGDSNVIVNTKTTGLAEDTGQIEISLDPFKLLDGLKVYPDKECMFEMGGPDRPVLLTAGENFRYVLMPIQKEQKLDENG